MKIELDQWAEGASIKLRPETPEEVSQLFRLINNVKKEPASFYLSFSSSPVLSISFRKLIPQIQQTGIAKGH